MNTRFGFFLTLAVVFGMGWGGQAREIPNLDPDDPIQVLSSSINQLVVEFNFIDPQIEQVPMLDGNQYTEVRAPGGGLLEAGLPAAPVFGAWVLIPNGLGAWVDDINPGASQLIGDDLRLAPVQPPRADMEEAPFGPFTIDEGIYGTNANFPGDFARLDDPQVLRGQMVTRLWLYPYQYNPVSGRLEVYPNLTVTIQFAGAGARADWDPLPIPRRLKSAVFERMMRRMAINANEVLAVENEIPQPAPPNPYGWNYIILTSSSLKTAADQLAAWKQKQGHTVLVEVLPSSYKAENLKNALLGAYQNWDIAPEYILLLGDSDVIPTNYKTWHPYNGTLYKNIKDSQGFTASDLYYATLESSNLNNPDGDLLADVLIGRMSLDSASEAQSRVKGSINYEKSPNNTASFYNTAVLAADFADGGSYDLLLPNGTLSTTTVAPNGIEDRRFTQTAEDLAIYLSGATEIKTANRQYYAEITVTPTKWNDDKQFPQEFKNFAGASTSVGGALPSYLLRANGFQWNGYETGITTGINNGAFLALHRGHGGRDHWGKPYYANVDVILLNNIDKLPVVWSVNCETGWFDNETDFKQKSGQTDWTPTNEEGMSEWWERPLAGLLNPSHDYGAVGVVAATRVSYSGYNEYLTLGMGDAIWPDLIKGGGIPGLGSETVMAAVLDLGKSYMLTKYGLDGYAQADLEGFHWFGDPALEIRTTKPAYMVQIADPGLWSWLLHPHHLIVEVIEYAPDGAAPASPAVGAHVSLSFPNDPRQVWSAVTDSEGRATFPDLVLEQPGDYNLLASTAESAPALQTLTAQPGSAGGIQFDDWGYNCSDHVGIHVADSDLAFTGLLEVQVSTVGGDSEQLWLEEVGPGYFSGAIDTELRRIDIGDGTLQVTDGDEITARYADADDGSEQPVVVFDTAEVDCSVPVFAGFQVIEDQCPVVLGWELASDLHHPLQYRIYRSQNPTDLPGAVFDTTWSNYYADTTCFPGGYFYLVRAVDRLGNESTNLEIREVNVPGLFLPIIWR